MRPLLPAVLAAVLLTAACTAGPRPRAGPGAPAAPEPATEAPVEEPVRVAAPWRAGMSEYGINVYWENTADDTDEVVRAKAKRILDYIVGLNANSVTFSFPFYTTGIRSTIVRAGAGTPTPRRVVIAVEEATRRGLRSGIRPILNEKILVQQDPDAWRGTIAPASRDAWFGNYRKLLLPYTAVGPAGATTFVAGTELNSLEGDRRWAKLIDAVKQRFPGEVAYSANFDSFQKGHVRVPAEVIGVDAYPRFDLDDDASVDDIAARWSRWLSRYRAGDPPVLHEVGIAAQSGGYRRSGQWGNASRPLNLTVQKHWYDGICQAMHDGHAGGVYWWKIDFDADPATARKDSADRMTFVGRPVEDNIRKCFARPA